MLKIADSDSWPISQPIAKISIFPVPGDDNAKLEAFTKRHEWPFEEVYRHDVLPKLVDIYPELVGAEFRFARHLSCDEGAMRVVFLATGGKPKNGIPISYTVQVETA